MNCFHSLLTGFLQVNFMFRYLYLFIKFTHCLDLSGLTLQSGTSTNGSGRLSGMRDEYSVGRGGMSPSPPGSSHVSSNSDVSGNSPAVTVQHHLPPLYHQPNPATDIPQQPTVSQTAGKN